MSSKFCKRTFQKLTSEQPYGQNANANPVRQDIGHSVADIIVEISKSLTFESSQGTYRSNSTKMLLIRSFESFEVRYTKS